MEKVSLPESIPAQRIGPCPNPCPKCPSYTLLIFGLTFVIILLIGWVVWSFFRPEYTKPGFVILPKKCDKSEDCRLGSNPPDFVCCDSKCKSGIKNASGVYECPQIGIP